jgi:hypothetical protein
MVMYINSPVEEYSAPARAEITRTGTMRRALIGWLGQGPALEGAVHGHAGIRVIRD